MIISIINREHIRNISLPEKIKGQYWLHEFKNGSDEKLVSVEGISDKWIMKSTRYVKILDRHNSFIKNVEIAPLGIYILVKSNNERVFIYVEPHTDDRQIFTKYLIKDDIRLRIGREEGCDICYYSGVVSSEHAVLSFVGGKWSIQDSDSTNGTFVNGNRISNVDLKIGDIINIMGMKIIIGKNIIAINRPDGKVIVSSKLRNFVKQPVEAVDEDEEDDVIEKEYFYRSPRFKRDIETAIFKIDSPPTSPVSDEMPWILVMGSSLTMGIMSVVTLVNAITSKNVLSAVMGVSMLMGTVLLPIITKAYEKKRRYKKEALRQEKYKEYLVDVDKKIQTECRLQEEILNENFITIKECEKRILHTQRNLWERGMGQNDFLRVRIGIGYGLLNAQFTYAERKFSLENDNLIDEMYKLCEKPKMLNNIPITYSLYEKSVSGVIGDRAQVVEFAKGMIMQLAALYSYDEVKFVFIYDGCEENEFGFVKWLPHVRSEDNKFRFIATNQDEAKELTAYMERIITNRLEINKNELEDIKPYYIVFSMSKELSSRMEMYKDIISQKENIHISVVNFYNELQQLPKECSIVVELTKNVSKMYDKNDITGKNIEFKPDINLSNSPLELSIQLANTFINNESSGYKLPGMITFMELFDVGQVEHLNVLSRWSENDPTKSLEAEVGVDVYGEKLMLDLHENFHGPHGLVAGMTGSGKSEFIITYILSLAVNYHPNEVAFILIDYKGGGMAKSFERLPHTAGIITNLDGAAIKRSLVSIESELKRREKIFAHVSKQIGVSNIDIYKYQKLYREGSVSEPLQHLFIISDEFAELKTQQREFMDQLISTARIGRSLGVHLILATQKPSGVVDDQIWSNSKFRVCLKVQERADSMDMLKRADAAELTDTGRFYLQVGYNELFELGQSAWSGATYYPSDRVVKDKDNSVVVIDRNARIIKQVKMSKKRHTTIKERKQLDVITEYLKNVADDEGIKIRPMWLEPIPALIYMNELREKYKITSEPYVLNPVIGEYDNPVHQEQNVLRLPLSKEGNAAIYGIAGCGKTSFLNAMIYSLITEHTPDEVNVYIMDFESETLRAFSKAPHVGDVIFANDSEKVSNLFKLVKSEIESRKKLFADYGGDYSSYLKASGATLPSMVIAINNFTAFIENYTEKEEAVAYLSRECTKYGIYFVVTALNTNALKFKVIQNFKQLLVLRLNDNSDYSTVVGKTEGLFPSDYKGRGLIRMDDLYEFQIAFLTKDEVPYRYISEYCIELAKNWNGMCAKKIPILPDVVNSEFLSEYIDEKNNGIVPIGVEKNTLNVCSYSFFKSYINIIMSSGNEYRRFLMDLASFMGNKCRLKGIVFDPYAVIQEKIDGFEVCSTEEDCKVQFEKLCYLVSDRKKAYQKFINDGIVHEKIDNLVIFINSLSKLTAIFPKNHYDALKKMLEVGVVNANIYIIIGEQAKLMSPFSYEKWYKDNVSISDGIWVGDKITEQYVMKASKNTPEMYDKITDEFGYALINGIAKRVKLLNNSVEEKLNE